MKVILSIKPEYANKIFDGNKIYEFRKTIFKNKDVKKIIVYSSSPIKKVIGEFEIEKIVEENLEKLWDITKSEGGITKDFFDKYFENKEKGYAIKIKQPIKYKVARSLENEYNVKPPQSFTYIK